MAWSGLVLTGWSLLWRYEFAAGSPAQAPGQWLEKAPLGRAAHGHQLLIFAHPRCPCTRATLDAVAQLAGRSLGGLEVRVWFLRPKECSAQWARTALWDLAESIPGARVLEDVDGATARYFGVETSGQALLYDAAGQLLLATGLTASRGHGGANPGLAAVESLCAGRAPAPGAGAVFGCPLSNLEKPAESCCHAR